MFTEKYKTLKVESGKSIAESLPDYDISSSVIMVNGERKLPDYILQEGDLCTLRIYPQGWFSDVFSSIGSGIASAVSAIGSGIYNVVSGIASWVGDGISWFVKQVIGYEDPNVASEESEEEAGTLTQNPTISGQKNQSAKDKPIPIILGETQMTPYYIGKPYTTIKYDVNGYGIRQEYHALYLLGYNDLEVTDFRLGYSSLATNYNSSSDKKHSKVKNGLVPIDGVYKSGTWGYWTYMSIEFAFKYYSNDALYIKNTSSYSIKVITSMGAEILLHPNVDYSYYTGGGANMPVSVQVFVSDGWRSSAKLSSRITSQGNIYFPTEGVYSATSQNQWISSSTAINLEVRETGEVSLYSQKIIQNDESVQLQHVQGTSVENGTLLPAERFSVANPMKIEMEVGFQGLYGVNDSGGITNASCQLHFQYSYDEITWHNFGITQGAGATYNASTGITTITANQNQTLRYCASKQFSYAELKNMIENDAVNYVYMRVWRVDEDATDTRTCNKVYLMATRTYCFDKAESKEKGVVVPQSPFHKKYRDKVMRVGLVLEANDSIKDNLDSFNCMVRSRASLWNGTEWGDSDITSNPAALGHMLFTHNSLGEYKYRDTQIDHDKFGEFYEYCDDCGFECNTAIVSQSKFGDNLTQVLDCGHGFPVPVNNRYSVFIDKPQENPVVILNNHNILSDGLSNTKSFEELCDGFEVSFINKSLDYAEDTILCMYDSTKASQPDVKLQKVSYNFITDRNLAWRKAKYELLKKKYRPETWTRRVGIEGVLCPVGSLIEIQDDTILVGVGDGGSVTRLVYDDDLTHITGFEIDGAIPISDLTVEYAVKFIKYMGAYENPVITVHKLVLDEEGLYKTFEFETPILATDSNIPELDDICSFGVYGRETTKCLCIEKKPSERMTYDLTLVPYDSTVYMYDTKDGTGWTEDYPEFDSKVTRPVPFSKPSDVPSDYITRNEYTSDLNDVNYGNTSNIGRPDAPVLDSVIAGREAVRLTYTQNAIGLRNNIKKYAIELSTDEGENFVVVGVTENLFYDYSIKGRYLEREDFANWRFRVYALSIYAKSESRMDDYSSEYSNTKSVSTSDYGTWKLEPPVVLQRVNDRTVTLLMSQGARSDNREVYGTINHKISVRKPGYDAESEFFCPGTNSDPYPSFNSEGVIVSSNVDNYKDVTSAIPYTVAENIYSQTMPLTGQGESDMKDTLYQFKVVAFNESGNESTAVIVNATALITSIRDIVEANMTAKEAYVKQLSAISANIGTISDGSFGGGDNMWDLSSFIDEMGTKHYKGKFRIGGADQYLEVVPLLHTGEMIPYDYEMNFKVGKFTLTSDASSINGELIVQREGESLDRAILTPEGVRFQHRYNSESEWTDVAAQDVNGVLTNQVHSDDGKLIITSQTPEQRREQGTDIGRVLLSDSGRVYHFDTNELDNHGNSILTITDEPGTQRGLYGSGDDDINGINFTPAILAVAPYSSVGKALYGQYSLEFDILQADTFTVDLWVKYIYAENQVLLKMVNSICELILAVTSMECFYGEYDPEDEDDVPYNIEITESLLFRKLEETNEPYFADDYNGGKLATEAVYNTVVMKPFKRNGKYYYHDSDTVTRNGGYKLASATYSNYDELVKSGLYEPSCVYNQPKDPDTFVRVDYVTGVRIEYSLKEMGVSFNEGEWLHCGIVQNDDKFGFYLNNESFLFDRTPGARDIHFTLNQNKKSFILDELMIEPTVFETINEFKDSTVKRIPWGSISKDEDWFILMAKDTSKIKTNIFDSDAFKNAVRRVIAE